MDVSSALYHVWIVYSTGWGLAVSVGTYLWFAACLMVIARKARSPAWWAGWIPLVNFQIVCALGKSSPSCFFRLVVAALALGVGVLLWMPWWIILWLVFGGFAWAVAWIRISRERGRSPLLGLLAVVPVLNLVLYGLLAFGDQA